MALRDRRTRIVGGVRLGGCQDSSRAGLTGGAIIVLIGVALLLDHLGVIHIGSLFRFWPMLLVFFGISNLFNPSSRLWGVLLILVGGVFQLNNLGITRMGIADLWPVLIIVAGVFLMWAAIKPPVVVSSDGTDSTDILNAVAVFGGTEKRIVSQNFKGGRATSVFGGVELDLRDANIEGEEATLDVNCIFGGVEIRVPTNWVVHSSTIPVLGGYADKTHTPAVQDATAAKRKTLVITGAVVFGGVEIQN